jgi:hypothetical protein
MAAGDAVVVDAGAEKRSGCESRLDLEPAPFERGLDGAGRDSRGGAAGADDWAGLAGLAGFAAFAVLAGVAVLVDL